MANNLIMKKQKMLICLFLGVFIIILSSAVWTGIKKHSEINNKDSKTPAEIQIKEKCSVFS